MYRRAIVALVALLLAGHADADDAPPVVVELFTSQGCSSCPPADAYLGELAHRPAVLALSFHVDYWNYIGWVDPFASPEATQRQRDYARRLGRPYVYTPQMVVDGAAEGVGSEPAIIDRLIANARNAIRGRAELTLARNAGGGLAVHVGGAALDAEPCTLWLVAYERSRVTRVVAGENDGRTLTEYQIVRKLESIGQWVGGALDVTVPASELGNGGIAVLLQAGGSGRIITAASIEAPGG